MDLKQILSPRIEMLKCILVAVDGSEKKKGFEYALQLRREDTKLVVLHVNEVEKPSLLDPFHDNIDRVQTQENACFGKKVQEEYLSVFEERGLKNVEFVLLEADDVKSNIKEEAQKREALLVVGSSGKKGLSKWIGSVSSWLVENYSTVLIVKT